MAKRKQSTLERLKNRNLNRKEQRKLHRRIFWMSRNWRSSIPTRPELTSAMKAILCQWRRNEILSRCGSSAAGGRI